MDRDESLNNSGASQGGSADSSAHETTGFIPMNLIDDLWPEGESGVVAQEQVAMAQLFDAETESNVTPISAADLLGEHVPDSATRVDAGGSKSVSDFEQEFKDYGTDEKTPAGFIDPSTTAKFPPVAAPVSEAESEVEPEAEPAVVAAAQEAKPEVEPAVVAAAQEAKPEVEAEPAIVPIAVHPLVSEDPVAYRTEAEALAAVLSPEAALTPAPKPEEVAEPESAFEPEVEHVGAAPEGADAAPEVVAEAPEPMPEVADAAPEPEPFFEPEPEVVAEAPEPEPLPAVVPIRIDSLFDDAEAAMAAKQTAKEVIDEKAAETNEDRISQQEDTNMEKPMYNINENEITPSTTAPSTAAATTLDFTANSQASAAADSPVPNAIAEEAAAEAREIEERKLALAAEQMAEAEAAQADEVDEEPTEQGISVITREATVLGDIITQGHIDIVGRVKGNIDAQGDVAIHGIVRGDVGGSKIGLYDCRVKGNLDAALGVIVDESSIIGGDVKTKNIIFDGKVKGNIDAENVVVLRSHSLTLGDVSAASLAVEPGAILNGTVKTLVDGDLEAPFEEVL